MQVKFKRKRKGKTDYKSRMNLLKTKQPRLAIRKTNKYIIAQIIKSKEAQDETCCYLNSKELLKVGWPSSFKNLPACYLTGKMLAERALEKGIKKCVIDLGRHTSTKGSKIYAVIKGAIDGGLEIPCNEKMFPTKERIYGKDTKMPERIKKIIEKK
jgi:large subunit ribosomal protein L18